MPPTPARGIVAVFSENKKEGHWALPRHLRVLTVFGNVTIDLREAMILPGESVIEVVAVFAEVKVFAPPYLNVESDGDALLGEFGVKKSKRDEATLQRPDPNAPFVRIIGSAYMASVTVRVKAEKKTPGRRALSRGST
ncbi:MAG TPA: LiaF domain-containing protein [Gemmatimonadaceae bacterium]|nr:LiaF domain-containing protein [Gemmatimonadaceae bacterium]